MTDVDIKPPYTYYDTSLGYFHTTNVSSNDWVKKVEMDVPTIL